VGPFVYGLPKKLEGINMVQSKNLAVAFAFLFALAISSVGNAGNRFYIEVGAATADPSDVTAEFTTENLNATWGLSDMVGGKLQIGGDFGHFRTDVKVRVFAGEVDTISGVTAVGIGRRVGNPEGQDRSPIDAIISVGTINAYWDIYDIKLGETGAGITPFVGIGAGLAQGFMRSCGQLLTEANVTRCDHRNDKSRAIVGSVGALLSINEGIGLTAEYERIDTDIGGLDLNTVSVGLRISF
jgi:hypothetical protein